MKLLPRALVVVMLSASLPARAQTMGAKEPSTSDKVKDAAMQPVKDVNLKKDEIPPELEAILDDPYALGGLQRCKDLSAAIAALDGMLGPDIDVVTTDDKGKKRRDTVIRLSGNFLSNLILPFRGVVREVSGSAEHQRRYRAAIISGVARRSFLKGVATARHCRLPAATVPE